MTRNSQQSYIHTSVSRYMEQILYMIDLFVLNVSFFSALYFRLGNFSILENNYYQLLIIAANVLWVLIVRYNKALKTIRIRRVENLLVKVFKVLVLHFGILSVFVVFSDFDDISRLLFIYFYLFFVVLIVLVRLLVFKLLKLYRAKGYNFRRVIIIGDDEVAEDMYTFLSNDLTFGYTVTGIFCDHSPKDENHVHLGTIDAVDEFVKNEDVSEMYVALKAKRHETIEHLIHISEKYLVRIKFIPDFRIYTKSRRVNIDFYGRIPVMMFRKEPLAEPLNRLVKKTFDIIFSLLVIVCIFPWLFPILAIAVKLSSPGPVFFKQKRSGEDNIGFSCYKFRTMTVNTQSDKKQATKNDARITKVGAFLRKTNLDEMPQFFNVLFGSMSVVGPRPHMLAHTREYAELIDNYLVRHYAKPGITGWAQVNGFRGETKEVKDMEGRVNHDIFYVENWSLLLDIKIVFRTVLNMLRGEKNAF